MCCSPWSPEAVCLDLDTAPTPDELEGQRRSVASGCCKKRQEAGTHLSPASSENRNFAFGLSSLVAAATVHAQDKVQRD
jgi:hypothetical protein